MPKTTIVVAGVIRRGGRILIAKRPENVHLGGLWEFPGGKVEAGESLEGALVREIGEELGVGVVVEGLIMEQEFAYPERDVRLHFFECRIADGEPACRRAAALAWVPPSALAGYPFPPANAELIEELKRT